MHYKKIGTILLLIFTIGQILPGSDHQKNKKFEFDFKINIRTYFSNDQRIQWSGTEATFGAEAVINGGVKKAYKSSELVAIGEFRLNQHFDDNILMDEFREKYIQNFKTDQFQIAQLFLGIRSKNFEISLGKKNSIFGNDLLIHLSNADIFQPFIRTESILWRETGFFFKFNKGVFILDLAIVNGGPEKDTNSSKAAILRTGIDLKNFSMGLSVKMQDGIGSEWQKQFKNHAGFDLTFKSGNFRITAEGIYDEYGFRKEFNSDDIFWKRSFYYRDRFYKHETAITGIGGYVDLRYTGEKFTFNLNYGEFHPEEIGFLYHDTPVKRGILKVLLNISRELQIYMAGLVENDRPREPVFSGAKSNAYILGLQYRIN